MRLNEGLMFPSRSFTAKGIGFGQLVRTSLMIALLFCSVEGTQTEFKQSVRGRVIDAQGQPIQGALVYLDAPTWADQVEGFTTGQDGKFRLEDCTSAPAQTRQLYVAGPIPSGALRLITPPFNLLPDLTDPAFAGRAIPVSKGKEIDLGDVPIQVSYARVKVYVLDHDGRPLLKDKKIWEDVSLRVRNIEKILVDDTTLSKANIEQAVNLLESSLIVALPEGAWQLEIAPFGIGGPWFVSPDQLIVNRGSRLLQQTFRVQPEMSIKNPK